MSEPLNLVKRIGDKLIRETPFAYRLEVAPVNPLFNKMHFVDFGRTFGLGRPAVAYAWTGLTARTALSLPLELEHNDGCWIWLNGELVYEQRGQRPIRLRFEERSLEMSPRLTLQLKAEPNSLLIESETRGQEWRVYLQPPPTKGAVGQGSACPEIGFRAVAHVDAGLAALTPGLVLGPLAAGRAGENADTGGRLARVRSDVSRPRRAGHLDQLPRCSLYNREDLPAAPFRADDREK